MLVVTGAAGGAAQHAELGAVRMVERAPRPTLSASVVAELELRIVGQQGAGDDGGPRARPCA